MNAAGRVVCEQREKPVLGGEGKCERSEETDEAVVLGSSGMLVELLTLVALAGSKSHTVETELT